MKKLIFLIFISGCFVAACKKKDEQPNNSTTHNVKYEVKGFLDLNITYDGKNIFAGKTSTWDYTQTASTGKSLSLSASNASGTQTIEVSIYVDGVQTQTANGYGTQSITDIVK